MLKLILYRDISEDTECVLNGIFRVYNDYE
jgi:hypothetical protein